ncbi:MAG: hypothetical protein J0L55_10205 [Caulobacterales bacterium]|nr:hypothetical protein [Caulobacterales bacterium]
MTLLQTFISARSIFILVFVLILVLAIVGFRIYRLFRPYDYAKESTLLQEFMYGDDAERMGFDTSSMNDFEKWKKEQGNNI